MFVLTVREGRAAEDWVGAVGGSEPCQWRQPIQTRLMVSASAVAVHGSSSCRWQEVEAGLLRGLAIGS